MTLIVSFEIMFILLFTLSVRIFILYKRCFTRCTRRVFLRNRSTALYIRNTILNTRKYYSQYEKVLFSIRESAILNIRSTILMARIVHLRKE